LAIDVNAFEQLEDTLNEIVRSTDRIDLIVNCIGIGELNPSLDSSLDASMIETNVKSFTLLSNWAYNLFKKQGHGHYAAISSIAGLRGGKDSLVYNASKAFQINFLEGLQHKAAKENKSIFISDIRPGLVDTAMAKGEGLFWVMPVEKVVKQIVRGIHQKKRVITVTKRWRLLALILSIMPRFLLFKT
jgi:short-subunit dehydrogenase